MEIKDIPVVIEFHWTVATKLNQRMFGDHTLAVPVSRCLCSVFT